MAEGDSELADLYRDVLLDYFRSPAHQGSLPDADFHSHGVNPICGDEVELTMTRKSGAIDKIRYAGHGCVISQASCAMMAEALEGRSVDRAQGLIGAFRDVMMSKAPWNTLPEQLEAMEALEGVRKFPVRIKCALLPWNTLKLGLDAEASGKKEEADYQETER